MKKLTLIAFFAIFTSPLFSQNFPFPTADAEWITSSVAPYFSGNCVYYYTWRNFLGPDTIINDKVHQVVLAEKNCRKDAGGSNCLGAGDYFFPPNQRPIGTVRTEGSKVYFYKNVRVELSMGTYESGLSRVPDSTEILLYDFNWAIGDTFHLPVRNAQPWEFVVIKRDTFLGRKRFTLERKVQNNVPISFSVVEGMGATTGLLGLYYSSFEPFPLLVGACFYHQGVSIYQGDCQYCGLVGDNEVDSGMTVRLYPNPASEVIRLEADPNLGPFVLHAYDLQGRLLYSDPAFPGNADLLPGSWSSGGWIQLVLQSSDGRVRWTGRVWHTP